MGFIPIPGSSNMNRSMTNIFTQNTLIDPIKKALQITEKLEGNPNPTILHYLDDVNLGK